jgi:hypothetical protein
MLVFVVVFGLLIAGCCAQSEADKLCKSQCLSVKEMRDYLSSKTCDFPVAVNKLAGCLVGKENCKQVAEGNCAVFKGTKEDIKEALSNGEELCKTEYSSFRSECGFEESSTGIIIGAVVGAVVLIGAVVGGVIFMKRRSAANVKTQHALAPQV